MCGPEFETFVAHKLFDFVALSAEKLAPTDLRPRSVAIQIDVLYMHHQIVRVGAIAIDRRVPVAAHTKSSVFAVGCARLSPALHATRPVMLD
jgi:hypothetical protein